MYQPDHATHTSETAHHDDRVQYLVVADQSSLDLLANELSALPLCARGRVFIEVDGADSITAPAALQLQVPLRMTVTWLTRSVGAGRPGTAERSAPGESALRAVKAWSTEMLCDGPGATSAILTGGYGLVAGVYDYLISDIRMSTEAVATPSAFSLPADR